MVPTLELPPATPLTLQTTPVFEAPLTLAVNCCVCPRSTEAVEGVTLTVTLGGGGGGGGPGAELVPAQPTSDMSKISAAPKLAALCPACLFSVVISIAFATVEMCHRTGCAKPEHSGVSRKAARASPNCDLPESTKPHSERGLLTFDSADAAGSPTSIGQQV